MAGEIGERGSGIEALYHPDPFKQIQLSNTAAYRFHIASVKTVEGENRGALRSLKQMGGEARTSSEITQCHDGQPALS